MAKLVQDRSQDWSLWCRFRLDPRFRYHSLTRRRPPATCRRLLSSSMRGLRPPVPYTASPKIIIKKRLRQGTLLGATPPQQLLLMLLRVLAGLGPDFSKFWNGTREPGKIPSPNHLGTHHTS